MNIPELFIRRPVMATLFTLAIVLSGVMAYRVLPVSDLPNIDMPTVVVVAGLPGASPETMATTVATPLERQFSTIAGIDSMSSVSGQGNTQVTLQFNLGRNIDAAALDVQEAIAAVQRSLPPEMPSPPFLRKANPADDPILILALHSESLALSEVDEYAETLVTQRLSTIEGVAQVRVLGAQKHAVRVQVNPHDLASRGIGLDQVRLALAAGNVHLPTGTYDGRDKTTTVQASGQLQTAENFRRLIVAYRDNRPVRLGDLGTIEDSVQNDKVAGWYNNRERSIILYVLRQPGANVVSTVDQVQAALPALRAQMPASIDVDVLFDRSTSIRNSVHEVKFTLVLAVALVVLVIFLFLRSLPATLISSVAMPVAVLGTFPVMYFFDYTVDNLSLLALTLSVGFVVDDAIVMLENIMRHVEKGTPVLEAARQGSREVSFTILSMTLSLVAVFIPVLFMPGLLGRLLHEFAVTISAAILVSGVVSLTLTPMLCSKYLRTHAPAATEDSDHGLFSRGLDWYRRTLDLSLRHERTVIGLAVLMVALSVGLLLIVPKGFIPNDDIGRISCTLDGPEDASFDAMVRYARTAAAIIGRNPYVEKFTTSVGSTPDRPGNTSRLNVQLVDRSRRPSVEVVTQSLRRDLAAVVGARVICQVPPLIRLGGRASASFYQYTLYGADLEELYAAAQSFEQKMRQLPGLTEVSSDLLVNSPQLLVQIDRDKASSLGLTAQQIEDTLYSALGARQVSTIYTAANQYAVILELEPEYQRDPAALALLYIRSTSGRLVPLESVVKLRSSVGPLMVNHMGQTPSVTISFNLARGVALSQATDRIERLAQRELPASVRTAFEGAAAAFTDSLRGLGLLLLAAVLVIYLVLGILYEDYIHPLTILSGLPAAGFGALLTLLLFRSELNIYGYVGIIMLLGIVKKNAIMLIDFALEAQRGQGRSPREAIREACLVRFRPIMMTTFAALAGALPIAVGWGAGSESRRSLGLAVVGGLVVSQLLTLYITPAFYIVMERLRARRKRAAAAPVIPLTHTL